MTVSKAPATSVFASIKAWLGLKADRRAVTALEYGIIAALVAVTIVSSVTTIGKNLTTTFTTVGTKLATANK